ncbi:MAG TPA: hypothetical protein VKT30_02800 [Caulobacteraceae bacterium]|nr:hypothetical protein [Caulobacteraceae bacterium]
MRLITLAPGLLMALSFASATADPLVAPPKQPPLSVWRADASDDLEHLQSGLVCPARFDAYKRTNSVVYDAVGLDVSCNYAAELEDVTVYLTRVAPLNVDAFYREAKGALEQARKEKHPRIISETHSIDNGLTWETAVYAEDIDIHSAVWIANLDGWLLEYRATYPSAAEQAVRADISSFTALVQKSAGARLALCAHSTAPDRPGAPITDRKSLEGMAMMSALFGAEALGAAKRGKAEPTPPAIWCVEGAVDGSPPLLDWRAVHADGSDGAADQVSAATMESPPVLVVAPDSLLAITNGASQSAPTPWVATTSRGDTTWVVGYFAGRPSAEMASRLFADVLNGKAKPLVGYSVKGGNVTISMAPDH